MNRNLICRSLSFSLVLSVLAIGCTKIRSTEIGTELIPAVDNINTFDTTLEVITDNFIFPDSTAPRLTQTSSGGVPLLLAGQINDDPQFGKTTGSLFFHFRPATFPYSYQVTDSLYLDSVVLSLSWSGFVAGDTNRFQKFNVHLLQTTPRLDSAYSINDAIPYNQLVGSRTFSPSELNDSVPVFRRKVANQLRIRLDNQLGQQLLLLDSAAGKPFNNDSLFKRFLPGLAVVPDPTNSSANALMGFNLSDSNSHIRVYYRYDSLGKRDTTYASFGYTLGTGFANQIRRQYNGSEVLSATAPGSDSLVYIQATPGTYATVKIPSLNGFKTAKGNVVVHIAQLVMTQVPTTGQNDDVFTGPEFLYLDYFDSVKKINQPFLFDAFPDGSYQPPFFGGNRRKITGPSGTINAEYKFNLTRHVQNIITRNESNSTLHLSAPYLIRYDNPFIFTGLNNLARGRVKLGGGNNRSPQKMYLRIVYSKI